MPLHWVYWQSIRGGFSLGDDLGARRVTFLSQRASLPRLLRICLACTANAYQAEGLSHTSPGQRPAVGLGWYEPNLRFGNRRAFRIVRQIFHFRSGQVLGKETTSRFEAGPRGLIHISTQRRLWNRPSLVFVLNACPPLEERAGERRPYWIVQPRRDQPIIATRRIPDSQTCLARESPGAEWATSSTAQRASLWFDYSDKNSRARLLSV